MRIVPEPAWVIEKIANEIGENQQFVGSVIADLRHVIDRLVSDDVTVALAPLMFRRRGEPVAQAVDDRFTPGDWRDAGGLKILEPRDFAREIGLPEALVQKYPMVFGLHVLADLVLFRGVDWEGDDCATLEGAFYAWRETYDVIDGGLNRSYHLSHVGLEVDFENWLTHNLDALGEWGYPVELVLRQPRFSDGSIGDLLCRVTEDCEPLRRGDWLMVENKATAVGLPARDQLNRYVQCVETDFRTEEEQVYGLLIADGTSVELQDALLADGLGYLSLTTIGYRDMRYRQHGLIGLSDDSVETVPSVDAIAAPPQALDALGASSRKFSTNMGPWVVDGHEYVTRQSANQALARTLGQYTAEEWVCAQRRVGLRR